MLSGDMRVQFTAGLVGSGDKMLKKNDSISSWSLKDETEAQRLKRLMMDTFGTSVRSPFEYGSKMPATPENRNTGALLAFK